MAAAPEGEFVDAGPFAVALSVSQADGEEAVIGEPLRRVEDFRLVTGRGRFSDDRALPGQLHAAFARSPHARLEGLETAAAERLPGVVAVLTAADYAGDGMRAMPAQGNPKDVELVNRDGRPVVYPALAPLAEDRIRRVGEAVEMAVARTEAEALAAAEAVETRYAPLPAAPDVRSALAPDATALWEEVPGNLSVDDYKGDAAAVAGACGRRQCRDRRARPRRPRPYRHADRPGKGLAGASGHAAQTVTLSDRPPFGGPAVQPCASAASAPLVIWEKRTGRISSVSKRPPASLVTRSRRWSSSSPAGIAIRPPGLSC